MKSYCFVLVDDILRRRVGTYFLYYLYAALTSNVAHSHNMLPIVIVKVAHSRGVYNLRCSY